MAVCLAVSKCWLDTLLGLAECASATGVTQMEAAQTFELQIKLHHGEPYAASSVACDRLSAEMELAKLSCIV